MLCENRAAIGVVEAYHGTMHSLRDIFESKASQTPDEKRQEMITKPVRGLILTLAAPSIIANLVTSFYNLSDTFFVGRLGTSASGAVGIAFVAMTAIQAVGFYFGQGTGNAISRYLGAEEYDKASVMASVGLLCSLVAGTLVAVLGNVFLDELCYIMGSTETILPYARAYMGTILIGAPWMASSHLLNMQLRFEGESFFSMIALVTGSLLNVMLTPLLMFVFGMGIAGAAWATISSQLVGFCLLVWESQRIGMVRIGPKWLRGCEGLRPGPAMLAEINNGGFPSFVRQVMFSVATSLLNNAAKPFGDAAIAAMTVVQRISGIGNFVQIGIGQGFQPVVGYNLGARRYDRIREGYFFTIKVVFAAVLTVGVFTCIFAPQLIAFFRDDPDVVRIGTLTMRLVSFTMPLTGVAMITNFLLQTSGRMWRATILGACRLGLVLGPVVVVLSHFLGLTGVQIAQPMTDVITGLITIPMAASVLSELHQEEQPR